MDVSTGRSAHQGSAYEVTPLGSQHRSVGRRRPCLCGATTARCGAGGPPPPTSLRRRRAARRRGLQRPLRRPQTRQGGRRRRAAAAVEHGRTARARPAAPGPRFDPVAHARGRVAQRAAATVGAAHALLRDEHDDRVRGGSEPLHRRLRDEHGERRRAAKRLHREDRGWRQPAAVLVRAATTAPHVRAPRRRLSLSEATLLPLDSRSPFFCPLRSIRSSTGVARWVGGCTAVLTAFRRLPPPSAVAAWVSPSPRARRAHTHRRRRPRRGTRWRRVAAPCAPAQLHDRRAAARAPGRGGRERCRVIYEGLISVSSIGQLKFVV